MNNNTTTPAIPQVVVLPESEWVSIKDLLQEVKDTLQTKSEEETNSQWIESTEEIGRAHV